ncbi:MAG: histidinol-phosphate transaminase [Ignavibacteriales bacterium]
MKQIRLDMNENPFEMPQDMKRSILEKAMSLPFNRYYAEIGGPAGAGVDRLLEKIADMNGVSPGMVTLGNGSDELIMINSSVAVGSRGAIIVSTPTFGMYSLAARVYGRPVVEVPMSPRFEPDLPRLLEEAKAPGCLVFVCRPNNPTGNLCDIRVVETLLCETGAVVIVDEAYYEFCGETVAGMLSRYPRLAVMRTMSKAWGIAGLRLGYMLASPEYTERVRAAKIPFNINILTQMIALEVLDRRDLVERTVTALREERSWLERALGGIRGITVFPSVTNFLLIRTPLDARRLHAALRERQIYVRLVNGLPDCIRVAVGTRNENEGFVGALERLVGS